MAESKMNEEDQRYINEMDLYIRQKELSLEHSKLLIKQCQDRIELDKKFAEVQQAFIELDTKTIATSKEQLLQFRKDKDKEIGQTQTGASYRTESLGTGEILKIK